MTGGGSGLGREFCLALADRGARVLVADIRRERADETAGLVRARGATAEAIQTDVTEPAQVEALARQVDALWGGTDILINNAGVGAGGNVGEFSLEDWAWVVRINQWGVIHGCHVFVPRMKAQRSGFILNVASAAGLASLPEMAAYNVTKAAVIALTETLHTELQPFGIHATALCPTFFPTNLMDSFRSATPRQRKFAETMFKHARATAAEIAAEGLAGLERNDLYVIPQADGKKLWRMKRLSPRLYFKGVLETYRRSLQPKP